MRVFFYQITVPFSCENILSLFSTNIYLLCFENVIFLFKVFNKQCVCFKNKPIILLIRKDVRNITIEKQVNCN